MTFDTLQPGERLFIDANIFVYHCNEVSPECKALIARCSRKEIMGFTSTAVIIEAMHRLMIAEALRRGVYQCEKSGAKIERTP